MVSRMSRIVTLGETMLRLSAPGSSRLCQALPGGLRGSFAGAEATVAAAIAHWGGEAAFASALPRHPVADACVAELRGIGVETGGILRTGEGRLGLFYFDPGAGQRPGEVIYDREGSAFSVTPPDAYDWESLLAGADWLAVSGITPAISRNAAEVARVAIGEADRRGLHIACDMNYRSRLWRWDPELEPRALAARTMEELLPRVDLLVCGREDAESTLGLETGRDEEEMLRAVAERFPRVSRVATTLRSGDGATGQGFGGLLYDRGAGRCFRAPEGDGLHPVGQVVDRLGAGDAFLAGLLFSLTTMDPSDPERAIGFAAAAGCLAHSVEGDIPWLAREEVEALASGDSSGRVRR